MATLELIEGQRKIYQQRKVQIYWPLREPPEMCQFSWRQIGRPYGPRVSGPLRQPPLPAPAVE